LIKNAERINLGHNPFKSHSKYFKWLAGFRPTW